MSHSTFNIGELVPYKDRPSVLSLVYTNLNRQLRGVSLVSSIEVERRRCALQVSSVARLQKNKES